MHTMTGALNLDFLNSKKTTIMLVLAMLVALALPMFASAGTTGSEFEELNTMLSGWASGYLGKAIAVAAFLFGSGIAVAKQSLIPAVFGILMALVFAIGPGIVDGMLTAVI